MKLRLLTILLALVAVAVQISSSAAQTLNDPAKDAELKKKNDDLALMQAETNLVTAKNNQDAARFPAISGGKEGTVSLNGQPQYPFAAQAEAYMAVKQAAMRICEDSSVKGAGANLTIVPLNYRLTDSIAAYEFGKNELEIIVGGLNAIKENAGCSAGPKLTGKRQPTSTSAGTGSTGALGPTVVSGQEIGVAGVAAAINTAVDVTKLFRVNRTVHLEAPQMTDDDLALAVGQCLPDAKHLDDAVLNLLSGGGIQTSFLGKLINARSLRDELQRSINGKDCPETIFAAIKRFDDYFISLGGVAGSEMKLLQFLKAEALKEAMKGKTLTVSIKHTGGATQKTEGFFTGQRLYASGGIVGQYVLRSGAKTEKQGLVVERTDFKRIPLH